MKIRNLLSLCLIATFAGELYGYGVGLSSYPLMTNRRMISAEVTGITSEGGGVGIQGRYSHKLTPKTLLDAGFGLGTGERSTRFFAGIDYEIFPDYRKQPKLTVKTTVERATEYGIGRNVITAAPTVSKGFSFWGKEGFPYASLPVGLSLDTKDQTYESVASLAFGISGNIPVKGYRHLTGNIEANFSLKDNYSGLFMGVSYPL